MQRSVIPRGDSCIRVHALSESSKALPFLSKTGGQKRKFPKKWYFCVDINANNLNKMRKTLFLIFFGALLLSCHEPDLSIRETRPSGQIVEDVSGVDISAFCEDGDGIMWMASQTQGLFRYDGRYYIQYLPSDDSLSISSKFVNCLAKDGNGALWIGSQKGVDRYDRAHDAFIHYAMDEGNRYILELVTDPAGIIYALTKRSLLALDQEKESFHSVIDFPQRQSIRTHAVIDSKGVSIFFDDSIETYDRQFRHIRSTVTGREPLPYQALYTDSRGNTWMSLFEGGYRILRSQQFAHTAHGSLLSAIEEHSVGTVLPEDEHIYVVLDNRSILVYDVSARSCFPETDLTRLLGEEASGPYTLSAIGKDGLLALGNGNKAFLLRHSASGQFQVLGKYLTDNPAGRMVFIADSEGGLWAAGVGATVYHTSHRPSKASPVTLQADAFMKDAFVNASCAISLSGGDILIAYSDIGLLHIKPASGSKKLVSLPVENAQYYIRGMQEDKDGKVWVFTSDEGLFRYDPSGGKITSLEAFKGADVSDVAEDGNGFLYCISGNTLYSKARGEDRFERLWSGVQEEDGLRPLLLLPDGQLELHTQNGFRSINILTGKSREALDVSLNVFLTEGDNVVARTDPHLLKARPIAISLPSRYQNLSLQFPVIEPYGQNLYNYAFRTGGSAPWQNIQGRPVIPLYNLSWGQNKLQLKAIDASTHAESIPAEVILTVKRPWYHYAMAIAVLLGLILVFWLIRAHNAKQKAAEKAENERKVQEQINRNNIDFFSNVSHEFRTPISLIEGAVSTLSEDKRLTPQQEQLTGIIRRNSGRMLRLVDQMLDFNRLDHDMLALQVSLKDASKIVLDVSQSFKVGAGLKQIDWRVEGCDNPCLMWVDGDKLEKILYNLCSNAMKHTPQGGSITMRLGQTEENGLKFARFTVEDSGPGIPPDKRQFIFQRFAQLPGGKKVGGTGIGLSYCKSLAELHHGSIEASGEKGAVFQLLLPTERQAYTDAEVFLEPAPEKTAKAAVDYMPRAGETVEGRPNVLVIDDDYEFVYYLQALLSSQFNVSFRFDAESGFEALEASPADLVISDVMMPGTDGMQLCRKIKETLSLCHIPVILLTAKASLENQIEGLGIGADAYIPKPFDKDYLLAMCRTLLENRKRIQQQLNSAGTTGPSQADGMAPLDREFMEQLYAIMERSLDEGEMNVDQVADQLHIGRSKFFYKVKALTGKTPNEFFTAYKLNRSLELLKSGKYKIAAVASMVGFSSASHFTTIFKKHFGYPPSQV